MQYLGRSAWRNQWGLLSLCLILAGVMIITTIDAKRMASARNAVFVLAWLGMPLAVLISIIAYRHFSWRFSIENGVIESRRGLIAREVRSVRVEDVRSINVKQSILQRLLNLGDIEFSSAASDAAEVVFEGISNPIKVKNEIQSLMG